MRSGVFRKQPRHALTEIASPINGRVLAAGRARNRETARLAQLVLAA